MGLRQTIHTVIGGLGALAAIYWLWYQFGPESALADRESMRKYKLSHLTVGDLSAIAEQAKQEAIAQGQERNALGQPVDVVSMQQRVEWHVMGSCIIAPLTIREARRIGCLPPE